LLSASRTPRSGRLGTPVRPSDLPISRGRNGTDGQPMRISQLDVLCRTRGAHKLPDRGDEIVDGERLLERSDCPNRSAASRFAAPLPEMAMIFTPGSARSRAMTSSPESPGTWRSVMMSVGR
jgi:hypothetical protein